MLNNSNTTVKAPATNKRVIKRPAKAAASKPAVAAATTEAAKPVKPPVETFGGFSAGNVHRTAAVVVAGRTHYGSATNRDDAYLALFALTANAADDKRTITLKALAAHGTNRFYAGSAKPHDGGAINRAIKAGNVARSDDGTSITLTEAGRKLGSAILSKLAKPAPTA